MGWHNKLLEHLSVLSAAHANEADKSLPLSPGTKQNLPKSKLCCFRPTFILEFLSQTFSLILIFLHTPALLQPPTLHSFHPGGTPCEATALPAHSEGLLPATLLSKITSVTLFFIQHGMNPSSYP